MDRGSRRRGNATGSTGPGTGEMQRKPNVSGLDDVNWSSTHTAADLGAGKVAAWESLITAINGSLPPL